MKRRTGVGGKRCPTGKVRYRDRGSAAHMLHKLAAQGERRGKTLKRYYECPMCLGWHLTSQE